MQTRTHPRTGRPQYLCPRYGWTNIHSPKKQLTDTVGEKALSKDFFDAPKTKADSHRSDSVPGNQVPEPGKERKMQKFESTDTMNAKQTGDNPNPTTTFC